MGQWNGPLRPFIKGNKKINIYLTTFSMCQINVKYFPLDTQTCEMKFGSWTYGGFEVDLQHKDYPLQREENEEVQGVDGEKYNETVWVVDKGRLH